MASRTRSRFNFNFSLIEFVMTAVLLSVIFAKESISSALHLWGKKLCNQMHILIIQKILFIFIYKNILN